MRTTTFILVSLALAPLLCCPLFGQSTPDESQLPATQVTVKTQVRVSSVLGSPAIVTPIKCGADGSIFLRLAANGAVQDLTGIGPVGNAVVFRANSITDVPNARPASFFVASDEVFLLVNAIEQPRWERTKVRTPVGKVIEQSQTVGQRMQYIARFDRSGKYRGTVKLDIPFRAYQFGAFQRAISSCRA